MVIAHDSQVMLNRLITNVTSVVAAIATIFFKNLGKVRESSSKNVDFVHRSGALARPGNRELLVCAVKFSASCDAWRPKTGRKTEF